MIRQAFGEGGMSRTRKFETQQDRERRYRCRAKLRAYSSFSLTSRALFTNNSPWKAKQSITHTTDVLRGLRENVRRLRPKLWREMN
jgi:hypothetical protein